MENKTDDLILQPHQKPKNIGQWLVLSLQHVFAMFGATVLVPIIINGLANETVINISMALFCSGFGTLIYIALTMAKVPIYLGSSLAYMTVIGLGWKDWHNAVFIAVFAVGLVYILVGFIIHWTGIKWIKKAFSPVVIGPIICIIGLSAVKSALSDIGFIWDSTKQYPQWLSILIGIIVFLTAAMFMLKAKSFLRVIPILIALVIGYVFTVILHYSLSGYGYKLLDTDLITNVSSWEWYPSFKGIWNVDGSKIGPALVAIVPISLVTMVEHLGDHINIGNMTNKNYIENPGISKTLMADGVAMGLSGLIGGPPNATYAENTSVVGITRVASVWVTGLAACMAIIMSFIAPINQIIIMIPKPVLGGISLMLFGMISSNGIKIMIDEKVDFKNAKNIIISSVVLATGIGMSITGSTIKIASSFEITGLFLATFLGLMLNLFLPDQDNLGFKSLFKRKEKIKKTKIKK
ncbi:uracil-xanthine permease family protein [Spiroplasma apis]|uniref:Uracil permease n=1 Tax=Spiroplasma apis B31 TaxID=1276258 RepID=V5RJ33_SPIAP|nr:uracil-xanthine permease family protein [Spiroplasma apis]AHB36106.1 uracil permease [Spiroplasma apis B31]